jgi:SAM-dependent methyltransferase
VTFTLVGSGPAAYEEYLVPALFGPLAEALLAVTGPPRDCRVLDLACGTGVVAELAAATAMSVTGVDRNPAMLEVARQIDPARTWVHGDATLLPLPTHAFDIVYCQQGLQYVAALGAALGEVRRVLVPGGRLAVALWCDISRAPGFAAFASVLDRHAGPSMGDILRAPFALGRPGPVREKLVQAGFTQTRVTTCVVPVRFPSVRAFFERQVAASPLAPALAGSSTEREMLRDLAEALDDRVDDDGLLFPAESHLITAVA